MSEDDKITLAYHVIEVMGHQGNEMYADYIVKLINEVITREENKDE